MTRMPIIDQLLRGVAFALMLLGLANAVAKFIHGPNVMHMQTVLSGGSIGRWDAVLDSLLPSAIMFWLGATLFFAITVTHRFRTVQASSANPLTHPGSQTSRPSAQTDSSK